MLPTSRATRIVVPLLALLLVPLAQPGLAHGGEDDGHEEPGATAQPAQGFGPQAVELTPNARYVEQRNPHAYREMVVWQERELGRDWDVIAYNLTTGGPAFPVTLEREDQVRPVVRGPWVAWEEDNSISVDIVVLNLQTGQKIRVPDSGRDELGPTLGERAVYYYTPTTKNTGLLRGYDLVDQRPLYPAGNVTVLGRPSAWGPYLAWAEGSNLEGKMRVMDTRNGSMREVPDFWSLNEGPVIGPWGVAFIADVQRGQRGTYTLLFDLEEGEFIPMRTGRYPHKNLGQCDAGVVWDQFRDLDNGAEMPVVAIWDGFTKKIGDFGYRNFDATCALDHFIYEKEMPAEDPDLPDTARIVAFNMADTRPPTKSFIKLEDGLERGIFQGRVTFRGSLILGDPREPLVGLWVSVDNQPMEPAQARRVSNTLYEWRYDVDTTRLFSGEHTFTVLAVDAQGTETQRGFRFFTDSPYTTDLRVFEQGLNVPREQPSPFPFNLIDHYQDFRQFYNTILISLALIALVAFVGWRWWTSRPRGRPEYVREWEPEDIAAYEAEQAALADEGEPYDAKALEPDSDGPREPVRFQLH